MWWTDYRIINNTKLDLNLNILFLIYLTFLSIGTISPCAVNPCLNGGMCTVSQLTNTYICSCNQYYYGVRCERMISRICIINILFFFVRDESVLFSTGNLPKSRHMCSWFKWSLFMSMSTFIYWNLLWTTSSSIKY
jgi:hypothetical protein